MGCLSLSPPEPASADSSAVAQVSFRLLGRSHTGLPGSLIGRPKMSQAYRRIPLPVRNRPKGKEVEKQYMELREQTLIDRRTGRIARTLHRHVCATRGIT